MKIAKYLKWHQWNAWFGGVGLLLFIISGVLHPVMSWTGPQPVKMGPPPAQFSAKDLTAMQAVLKQLPNLKVLSVKIVPYNSQKLLQLTIQDQAKRRYFDLATQQELVDFEPSYAKWLAQHYTGLSLDQIKNTYLQTEFDQSYPWVNRLLPVYKIDFADQAKTSVFIHTELGALASITNTSKTRLQTVFQWLHTWSWLPDNNMIRFTMVLFMVSSVLSLCITGAVLIFKFKRRQSTKLQQWHRYLAISVWVPLTCFALSGSYHLIYSQFTKPVTTLLPPPPLMLQQLAAQGATSTATKFEPITGPLLGITFINFDGPLYRLSVAAVDQSTDRAARFRGLTSEGPPRYINALTGKIASVDEVELAKHYAVLHVRRPKSDISAVKKVTSFGADYDFRNKRLPVWQVSFDKSEDKPSSSVFIDTANGLLVDQQSQAGALEGLSFSMLHKYNFLIPFTGRFYRDVIMVAILAVAFALTLLGAALLGIRQRRSQTPNGGQS